VTALDPDEQAFLDLPAAEPRHFDCPGYYSDLGADGLPWPATRQAVHHDWPGTFDDLQLPEEGP
jgi:hypothetical protein